MDHLLIALMNIFAFCLNKISDKWIEYINNKYKYFWNINSCLLTNCLFKIYQMFNNQTIKGTFIETNYLYCVMCSYELSVIS
jgi:hypothetical protein